MSKEEKKELYSCKLEVTQDEYVKFLKLFPSKVLPNFAFRAILAGGFSALISGIVFDILIGLVTFIVTVIAMFIILFISFDYQCKLMYKMVLKKVNPKYELVFYEDYVVSKRDTGDNKYFYTDFGNAVETDTNFYLFLKNGKKVLNISKGDIDLKLINFIRKSIGNIENRLGKNMDVKKCNNPKFIKIMLNVLLWLSAISIPCYFIFISEIQEIFTFYESVRLFEFDLLFMIFPLLGIILGIKYKNRGFNCKNTIVLGTCAFIFISVFLFISLIFRLSEIDYDELKEYHELISVDVPEDIYISKMKSGTCPIAIGGEDCSGFTINFTKDSNEVFYNNILKSDKWYRHDVELHTLYRNHFEEGDTRMYLIYNFDTKEFNAMPKETGKYKMLTMEYDHGIDKLNIIEYIYEVK